MCVTRSLCPGLETPPYSGEWWIDPQSGSDLWIQSFVLMPDSPQHSLLPEETQYHISFVDSAQKSWATLAVQSHVRSPLSHDEVSAWDQHFHSDPPFQFFRSGSLVKSEHVPCAKHWIGSGPHGQQSEARHPLFPHAFGECGPHCQQACCDNDRSHYLSHRTVSVACQQQNAFDRVLQQTRNKRLRSLHGNTENSFIRVVNPTSLHANLNEVLALGKGTTCLAETAHTEGKARAIATTARAGGFHNVLGPPVPFVKGEQRSSPMHAGVGVLSTCPIWTTPGQPPWANTYRTLDVMIQPCDHIQVRVVTFYGVAATAHNPHAQETTLKLLENLLDNWTAHQGPLVLAGDFNLDLSNESIGEKLFSAGWVDCAQHFADREGGTAPKTYKGVTRIDQIWVNSAALAFLARVETRLDSPLSGHAPVECQFAWPAVPSPARVWPIAPSIVQWDSTVDANYSWDFQGPNHTEDLGNHNRVEQQFAAWSAAAEKWLCNASGAARSTQPTKAIHCATRPKPITPITLPPEKLGEIDAVVSFAWHKKLVAQHRRLHAWDNLAAAADHRTDFSLDERLQLIKLVKRIKQWPGKGISFSQWMSSKDPCVDYQSLLQGEVNHSNRTFLKQRFLEFSAKEIQAETAAQKRATTQKFNQDWKEGGSLSFKAVRPPQVPPILAIGTPDGWVAEPNALAELLLGPWEAIWNRHQNIPGDTWNTVLDQVLPLLSSSPFEPPPIGWKEWRRAVRKLGKFTAPGLCGWRGQELCHLPESVVTPLLDLFNHTERTGLGMPQQLLHASVAMIAKCLNPSSSNDCRPITVLSCVYRCWMSARASSMQSWLAKIMPAEMRGFLAGRHLDDFLYGLSLDIEAAHQGLAGPLLGMSLDITKAFNYIPREAAFAILGRLGLADWLISAWRSNLSRLHRRAKVSGTLSRAVLSCTGFPEGCPMSPIAMLAIGTVWHRVTSLPSPLLKVDSFADNFNLSCDSIANLLPGLELGTKLLTALDLHINAAKCAIWSTDPSIRSELDKFEFCLGKPSHVYDVRELGGHFSFTRVRNKTVQKRVNEATATLGRIARLPAPFARKVGLTRRAALPKAIWGLQLTRLGKKRIDSLTAAAKTAVGLGHAGSSPYVALAVINEEDTHPAFAIHRHRIHSFWKWLRGPESSRHDLSQMWAAQLVQPGDGPISLLGEALAACDLDLDLDLNLVTPFGLIELSTSPWRTVYRSLVYGFHRAEGLYLSHRKVLGQVGTIDAHLFRKGLASLTEEHQGLVRVAASGARFENAEIARYNPKFDEKCAHCGYPDTRDHRLTECPATAEARADHLPLLARWDTICEPLRLHLLPSLSPKLAEFWTTIQNVPDPDFVPRPPGPRLTWFTDGSGQNPTSRFCLVSFAGVCVEEGSCLPTSSFQGILPGPLQSVDRGELYAIIGVLQRCHSCDIFTDSKYAAEYFHLLLTQGWTDDLGTRPNSDLLALAHRTIGSRSVNEVNIQWVKAHRDLASAISGSDAFRIRGNALADSEANEAYFLWDEATRRLAIQGVAEESSRLKEWNELADLHVKVAKVFAHKTDRHKAPNTVDNLAETVGNPGSDAFIDCGNLHSTKSVFPADFVWSFCTLLSKLQWNDRPAQTGSGTPLIFIGLLFFLHSGRSMPTRDHNTWFWTNNNDQSIRRQANTLLIVVRLLSESLGREVIPGFLKFFKKIKPVAPLDAEIKWAVVPFYLEKTSWDQAILLARELQERHPHWTTCGFPSGRVSSCMPFRPTQLLQASPKAKFAEATWSPIAIPPRSGNNVLSLLRGGGR